MCGNIGHFTRDYKFNSTDDKDESYKLKYKISVASLNKKNLGSKVFLAKNENWEVRDISIDEEKTDKNNVCLWLKLK